MTVDTSNHSALVPTQTRQEITANIYGQSALLSQCDTTPMSAPVEEIVNVDQELPVSYTHLTLPTNREV